MSVKTVARWVAPLAIAIGSYGGYAAIVASAPESNDKQQEQSAPVVRTASLFPTNHKVVITSHGELIPLEQTHISAQVSGEVVSWHPNFVAGGVVKRGEILFSIETDNYEAAVLQAEANLASARAALIEEQAKGKVAEKQAKNLGDQAVSDLYLRKPQLLSAQAQVKSAQAALKRATRDLENCEVRAPYDALVIEKNIGVGQFISVGNQVGVVNNIEVGEVHIPIAGFDTVFLPAQLLDTQAKIVQRGVTSISREGMVVRDLGVVDSATRMINMAVQINDPYSVNSDLPPIKFGSYVEVSFTGKELSNIYRLPQELVTDRKIWVVDQDNQLQHRHVNVLRTEGEFILAESQLDQQDQLVLTPPEFPQQGMAVTINQDEKETQVQ